jgi:hypothetical protein
MEELKETALQFADGEQKNTRFLRGHYSSQNLAKLKKKLNQFIGYWRKL